ncbi:MAG: type II toxin-antitoxin system RelE/ParE family toxin [Verrucomicrobiota bacterium]
MAVRFHRRVQHDLNQALDYYRLESAKLADEFFDLFIEATAIANNNPKHFHFDPSGLRRFNLKRFPYHFLYDENAKGIRIWVLRHNKRHPSYGLRRFK